MIDSVTIAIEITQNVNIMDCCGYNVPACTISTILNPQCNTQKRYLAKKNFNSTETNYYPQVELSRYANQPAELIVTFSVPKLIFNTNLFEVTEQDYPQIVQTLRSKLYAMGIYISEQAIHQAKVYSLHIGKNINLGGVSCAAMLSAIKKMNFTKKLIQQSQLFEPSEYLKNIVQPGEQVSLWSKKQQICFYDKSSEIAKTAYGRELINQYPEYKNTLRYEYRMLATKKVKDVFCKCGFVEPVTFSRLFHRNRLNKLNVFVWENYIKPHITNFCFFEQDPINLIDKMIEQNISGTAILKILGANVLINSEDGARILKNIFPARTGVISNLLKDVDKINIIDNPIKDSFDNLEMSIINYEPLRGSKHTPAYNILTILYKNNNNC